MSKDPNQPHARISAAIRSVENIFLLLIAVFTVIAMGLEIKKLFDERTVSLEDLMLMFIYVEVLGMIKVYYDSKKIPILIPIFIAITAISRLIILQGKAQPPINILYEGIAILFLAIACVVISYRDDP